MVRITIEDLPVLEELTQEEMASIMGGDAGVVLGDVQVNVPAPLPNEIQT
jgi:bacteriocin-like protein